MIEAAELYRELVGAGGRELQLRPEVTVRLWTLAAQDRSICGAMVPDPTNIGRRRFEVRLALPPKGARAYAEQDRKEAEVLGAALGSSVVSCASARFGKGGHFEIAVDTYEEVWRREDREARSRELHATQDALHRLIDQVEAVHESGDCDGMLGDMLAEARAGAERAQRLGMGSMAGNTVSK